MTAAAGYLLRHGRPERAPPLRTVYPVIRKQRGVFFLGGGVPFYRLLEANGRLAFPLLNTYSLGLLCLAYFSMINTYI